MQVSVPEGAGEKILTFDLALPRAIAAAAAKVDGAFKRAITAIAGELRKHPLHISEGPPHLFTPTGADGDFRNRAGGGVIVTTVDGDVAFEALIDAHGQASAPLGDLPFPSLTSVLPEDEAGLHAPFRLDVASGGGRIYCLSMPQVLRDNPFSQGLANCRDLGSTVARDVLPGLESSAPAAPEFIPFSEAL